jgi:hypothetical protein
MKGNTMKLAVAVALVALVAAPALAQGERRGDRFPNLPPVRTWHHAGYWCEPEQNPPEGWLRPGGFCEAARQTAKASLFYKWK